MQLKLFDILSLVIPGALVICCLLFTRLVHLIQPEWVEQKISVYKDISAILAVVFIVACYLVGYVIHAIGSWIEPILWKTWGGRPSQILFSDDSSRLGLGSEKNAILTWLKSKSTDSRLTNLENNQLRPDDIRRLFQVAKNLAFKNAGVNFKTRIEEFNNSYIFSRNILVAFVIALGCVSSLSWYGTMTIKSTFLLLAVVLIVWWRARDRAIYYSREILVAGYYGEEKSK